MSNIVLIGMPGCGKSTVGVILAKTLGIGFVDTDLIIQQNEKRLLQEIIDNDGIEKFLDCEAKAVLSFEGDNFVVATGGSVIFREEAINHLKKNGKIIYLNVTLEEIEAVVKDNYDKTVEFVKTAPAEQYRQSLKMKNFKE